MHWAPMALGGVLESVLKSVAQGVHQGFRRAHGVVGGEQREVGGAFHGVCVLGQAGGVGEAGLHELCARADVLQRAVVEALARLHRLLWCHPHMHRQHPRALECIACAVSTLPADNPG